MIIFADFLRSKIEDANLSQAEVARRAGMRPSQLAYILAGNGSVTITTILRLAEALEMRPRDLIPP